MTELQDTLEQYRHSCELLRRRIGELNDRIYGRRALLPGETRKQLEGRRYLLYCEQMEMRESIAQMKEYLRGEEEPAVAGF